MHYGLHLGDFFQGKAGIFRVLCQAFELVLGKFGGEFLVQFTLNPRQNIFFKIVEKN